MKKKCFSRLVMTIILLGLFMIVEAQEWNYINNYKGIDVYWRTRKEAYATKYISELKFVNNNSYRVKIQFKARFICAEGDEFLSPINGESIDANSTKAGQFAGLWWYPCGDGDKPRNGGYRDMDVKEVDD